MDIRHYTVSLDVDPANQSIAGFTTIDLNLSQSTNVLLFDLLDSFQIKSVVVNGKGQTYKYENNLIRIQSTNNFPAGKITATIAYSGKPHVAIRPPWDDGFTWTTDSLGKPWVAVTAEGTGGKIFYPCKDHPSDEPNEGADMMITVPKSMVVAGPGLLKKVSVNKDKATYHWKTNYTINNYSIVFNAGDYTMVEKQFTTVNGNKVPMQFYVLKYHASKAPHHLEVFERTAQVQEKYFGEYPWIKEKIGIVETPHLGMEHQTLNAYGNHFRYTQVGGKDFDWLLHHEFGHEWWGNKITAKDWADMWIHEGICTFGDKLYILELEGRESYLKSFRDQAVYFQNEKPIVQGTDLDEESAYISDIYGKGAFVMHSLQYVLGDSVFFPALKNLITGPAYTYDNLAVTDDIINHFNKAAGKDLTPFFNLFLRTPDKLQVYAERIVNEENGNADYAYAIRLLNLNMEIPMQVKTSNGTKIITVSNDPVIVTSTTLPIIDEDMIYLSTIIYN